MEKKEKDIIAFVMKLPLDAVESIRAYEKAHKTKFRIMVIWDSRVKREQEFKNADIVLECDFSKSHRIAEELLPYQSELLAITCRSEQYTPRFAQVIPHVPYLRTPSAESLRWATDKYEMRKRFRLFDPKMTPVFTKVKDTSKKERARVIEKIGFPMIIKPTNLAASLLVSICYHEEELEKTIKSSFRKLRKAYNEDKRMEDPGLLAETYMEGDMYSIDSYVNSRGGIVHCPLVKVVTGKKVGHDDFYNYSQMTPTRFKKSTVDRAEQVAETAIHALGLRSTTVHTELMKIDDEWKVIEIGPRLGGFRHALHSLSCDIDHAMNDILNRIPKKPVVPKKCKGYATLIKWFLQDEGRIQEMKGIKRIENLESFHSIQVNKKIGDRAVFARNGGRSIFNVILYNADRSKLLADMRRIEQIVKIKVKKNGAH